MKNKMEEIVINDECYVSIEEFYIYRFKCPNCGYDRLNYTMNFCPNCGRKLKWELGQFNKYKATWL